METPFNIGDVYYRAQTNPYQVEVPCPTCYGARKVTMILGNGDYVDVECEACGKGYEGPKGSVCEYRYNPQASAFVVKEIHSLYDGKFTLRSTSGEVCAWESLYTTREEALAISAIELAKVVEQNIRNSTSTTAYARKNACWTIRYHEDRIKEYQGKIEWHRAKVSERRKCK